MYGPYPFILMYVLHIMCGNIKFRIYHRSTQQTLSSMGRVCNEYSNRHQLSVAMVTQQVPFAQTPLVKKFKLDILLIKKLQ